MRWACDKQGGTRYEQWLWLENLTGGNLGTEGILKQNLQVRCNEI
jgi:hypothetical protein